MKGELTIVRIAVATGKQDTILRTRNLILNACMTSLCNLLGGTANAYVSQMQFGTGTAAPTVTDTTLQRPITPVKAVTAVATPGTYTVEFSAYLGANEGNGFPLTEAGLLTAGNILVARTTFAARTKTSDYQYGFQWTITTKSA